MTTGKPLQALRDRTELSDMVGTPMPQSPEPACSGQAWTKLLFLQRIGIRRVTTVLARTATRLGRNLTRLFLWAR